MTKNQQLYHQWRRMSFATDDGLMPLHEAGHMTIYDLYGNGKVAYYNYMLDGNGKRVGGCVKHEPINGKYVGLSYVSGFVAVMLHLGYDNIPELILRAYERYGVFGNDDLTELRHVCSTLDKDRQKAYVKLSASMCENVFRANFDCLEKNWGIAKLYYQPLALETVDQTIDRLQTTSHRDLAKIMNGRFSKAKLEKALAKCRDFKSGRVNF